MLQRYRAQGYWLHGTSVGAFAVVLAVAMVIAGPIPPAVGAAGDQLWVARYRHIESVADAVVVSPDGSRVYVSGFSHGSRSTDDYDYATVAYDAATGARVWARRYNGPADDFDRVSALAVSLDGSSVFVTGRSPGVGTDLDFATVAYDAATGATRWERRYNSSVNGLDGATALGVSPDGSRVYVTGYAGYNSKAGTLDDYLTLAYDASSGQRLWLRLYDGPAHGSDVPNALGVSAEGSTVFVTGGSARSRHASDYATVAYDATSGATLWVSRYPLPGNVPGGASALTLTPDASKVIVTGTRGSGAGADYLTVAYDAVSGAELWARRYNGPGNDDEEAVAVSASPDGSRVFVTGSSYTASTGFDYATVAYDVSTGAKLWVSRYAGPSSDDVATALVPSPDGSRVFVTGWSIGSGPDSDYATVAYDAVTGGEVWTMRYSGSGYDYAYALAASPGGTVYVTGSSPGAKQVAYATVAYSAN